MTISTSYGYSSTIYSNPVTQTSAGTSGTGNTSSQTPASTVLRQDIGQDVGVEVTLSPAALQLLAQQAAAADTPDTASQITSKIEQVLSTILLNSGDAAQQADNEQPPLTGDATTDNARKATAQQATDFTHGDAPNPFAGDTPSDLAAIIIDKDGQYTVNERRAAYSEFARQDDARITDALTPQTDAEKKADDAEVPKSGNADRITSAKQATDFLNGVSGAKNPFADKSRDELTAIIDNDTGDYTVNERRAALAQRNSLEQGVLANLAKTPSASEQLQDDSETIAGASADEKSRAQDATRFVHGWTTTNPFAGLTQAELNAVVYDDNGKYTTNEKRAAYDELKQYLPAGSQSGDSSSSSDDSSSSSNSTDNSNPYSSGGAYSQYLTQQLIRAQNTSYLLSLLGGSSSGAGGNGSLSLVNYLT